MFKSFFGILRSKTKAVSTIDPSNLAEALYPTGRLGQDYRVKSSMGNESLSVAGGAVGPLESGESEKKAEPEEVKSGGGGKREEILIPEVSDNLAQRQDAAFVDYLYGGVNPVENGVKVILNGGDQVEVRDSEALTDHLDYKRLWKPKNPSTAFVENERDDEKIEFGKERVEEGFFCGTDSGRSEERLCDARIENKTVPNGEVVLFDDESIADSEESDELSDVFFPNSIIEDLKIIDDEDATPHRDLIAVENDFEDSFEELNAYEVLYSANLRQIHNLMYEEVDFEKWPQLWSLCFCGLEEVRDLYFDADFLVEDILESTLTPESVRIFKLEILHLLLKAHEVIFEAYQLFSPNVQISAEDGVAGLELEVEGEVANRMVSFDKFTGDVDEMIDRAWALVEGEIGEY